MTPLVVSLLSATIVPTAPTLRPEAVKTLDALQGKWSVEGYAWGAARVPAEVLAGMTLTVHGDCFDIEPNLQITAHGDGRMTFRAGGSHAYWVKLDPTTNPPRIDLLLASGDKPHTFRGIFQVDGDRLVITYAKIGDRPTKFSTGGRPELTVLEFRRAKK